MDQPTIGNAVPKRGNRFWQWIAGSLLSAFGWVVEAEVPNESKIVLIGAPHTSNWDFLVAMGAIFSLDINMFWMGKHTMFRWPFKGIIKWLGGLPIDRSASSGVVDQMIEAFNERDELVIGLAPEGTRKGVAKWKTGFYHIAHGAKVPIVMVQFDYGRKAVVVGPTLIPSGDIRADMAKIRSVFSSVEGKYRQPTGEEME